ncbi:MAG: DUF3780 domain-containing protein [Pseudomonadota bacterium]|nr:DUF3780 domain-containing protein [Pseudomonadota bacterium]
MLEKNSVTVEHVGTETKRSPKKKVVRGFGFVPIQSEHHFLVTVPASRSLDAGVHISEHFQWQEPSKNDVSTYSFNNDDAQLKSVLPRRFWDEICEEVKAEFNRRLRGKGLKTGKWLKKGQIPVEKSLGKELVLLAWAIEECDPFLIGTAVRNWLGLVPEERWWLYTMTNASTGHAINDKGKGWRKAVRFALTENPVSEGSRSAERRHLSGGLFDLLQDG